MVILTWKCLLSGLMLCDSHIMESPWASSPKTYKPMSSFVGPPLRSCSAPAPALCTWLKFQSGRQGFGSKAGICRWSDANRLSWEALEIFGRRSVSSLHFRWFKVSCGWRSWAHARWIPSLSRKRGGANFQGADLMKHISDAFSRSALELKVRLRLGRETDSIHLQLKEMHQLNTLATGRFAKMLNCPFNACWSNACLDVVSQLPRSFPSYLHSSTWAFHTCFTQPSNSTHGRAGEYLWLPATHLIQPPKATWGVLALQHDVICIKQTDWSQVSTGDTCHTLSRHFQNKLCLRWI